MFPLRLVLKFNLNAYKNVSMNTYKKVFHLHTLQLQGGMLPIIYVLKTHKNKSVLNGFFNLAIFQIIKFIQSTQFINKDLRMYHIESNTPALARTSNLNEELGQVFWCYIFLLNRCKLIRTTVIYYWIIIIKLQFQCGFSIHSVLH